MTDDARDFATWWEQDGESLLTMYLLDPDHDPQHMTLAMERAWHACKQRALAIAQEEDIDGVAARIEREL
jgi:hypothetical protein